MISQKRFFSRKTKLSKPSNTSYQEQSENMVILDRFQPNILNIRKTPRYSRPQLAQIPHQDRNSNKQYLKNKSIQLKSCKIQRNSFTSIDKNSEDNLNKFLEYSLNENFEMKSSCFDAKRQGKGLPYRPKTSMSQQSQKREDSVKTWNVVFSSKQLNIEEARISSSRALSKYSLVQRKTSLNRFTVKKDKSLAPSYLSAKKILFQVKQKKEKLNKQNVKENRNIRRLPKSSKCPAPEQFQINGWDFE